MRFFAIVIVMRAVGALVLPALLAAERTRTYAVLTTVSAVINFVLNLILIPRMHSAGAIVATIVSYSFLLVFGMGSVMKVFGVSPDIRALSVTVRTLLAGVICSAITWVVLERMLPADFAPGAWVVILWTLVQAMLYTVLAVGLRVISSKDLRSFLPLK
jgi:O-antigen/teichoic acid export membrane protein